MIDAWPMECCPACLESDSIDLGDVGRLCLKCRHEWDPAVTTGPIERPASGDGMVAMQAPSLVVGSPDAIDLASEIDRARGLLVGREVMWFEEGVPMRVTEITDDGYAILEHESGFVVPCTPDEFSLIEESSLEDEVVHALGAVTLEAASMVVAAAVATMHDVAGTRTLGIPPDDYLPADVDAIPVVAQGAAYAVAMLAMVAGVSTDQLSDIATMLGDAAGAAKEATGL